MTNHPLRAFLALLLAGCALPPAVPAEPDGTPARLDELRAEVAALRRDLDFLAGIGAPSAVLQRLDTAERRLDRLESAGGLRPAAAAALHLYTTTGSPPARADLGLFAGGTQAFSPSLGAIVDVARPVELFYEDAACAGTPRYPAAEAGPSRMAIGPDSTLLRPAAPTPARIHRAAIQARRVFTEAGGRCEPLSMPALLDVVDFADTRQPAQPIGADALWVGIP